jgi:hypothetical protein
MRVSVPKIAVCGRLLAAGVRRAAPTETIRDMRDDLHILYIRMRSPLVRSSSQRTQCPTEHDVIDDLELLIAALAREKAHHHHCSLAAATRQIRGLCA